MVPHCLQSWEESEIPIGHGTTPIAEGLTEENLKETSEQKETTPHAPNKQTPKTNTAARQLLMDSTQKEEVTTKERDHAEGDETNGPESNLRDNSTGPTALNLGRIAPTSTPPGEANVNPLPAPIPLRHLNERQKEPLQDPNTSSRAAGAKANQHSQKPKQGRDAGRDKDRKRQITTTPLGSAPAAPTPEDRRGKSHNSPDGGAKGATKETSTTPKQEIVGTYKMPDEGGRLLSRREELSKPDLPGQAPKRADSQPHAPEERQKQHLKGERTARKGAKTPNATSISNTSPTPTNEGRRGQPPGLDTTHEPDGQISDTRSAITGFIEFTNAVTSETIIRREQESSERYHPYSTEILTSQSDCTRIAPTEVLETGRQPAVDSKETVEAEITEQEPTLTKDQTKRRKRQARANGQGNRDTACFTADTLILVNKQNRAGWTPIVEANPGDIVVQSNPSGKIDDLAGAVMTPINTVCMFECPDAKIDLKQIGKTYITAHHHIHTENGWMTARQASNRGQGKLWTKLVCKRVYSLCLDGGGNIMVNTTELINKAPTQLEAATILTLSTKARSDTHLAS